MASGLGWKKNEAAAIERRRRFLRREMRDGILAILPVNIECEAAWQAFETKWGRRPEGEEREFPSNEEVYDRTVVWLEGRAQVEDDWLPVVYSTLDVGEGMVGGVLGQPIKFFHRPRSATYSWTAPLFADGYGDLQRARFREDRPLVRRLMDLIEYVENHAAGRFAQHTCLTMDALNYAVELRGATETYLDLYEHPAELRQVLEIGLDFNIRFQEMQFERIAPYQGGSFCWLVGWSPYPRTISFSVDAHTMCSVAAYVETGFEYNRRLIEHFGHGAMHFHCYRADLAAEVAKLPGLVLFQYGAGLPNGPPDHQFLPAIRQAIGDIPILVCYPYEEFVTGLAAKTLLPNVLYSVEGRWLSPDEANRLMDTVRAYRA